MNERDDITKRNIELSAEFSRYLFEHPEIEKKLAEDIEIILLPEFDNEVKQYNLKTGKKIKSEGGKVIYISIKKMRPKILSRIEGIQMERV